MDVQRRGRRLVSLTSSSVSNSSLLCSPFPLFFRFFLLPTPHTMFGIFPASGGLGGSTLQHLFPLLHPAEHSQVVLIARNPDKLAAQKELGAVTRRADYDEPETLLPAFEGIETLCLISYASNQKTHRIKVRSKSSPPFLRASSADPLRTGPQTRDRRCCRSGCEAHPLLLPRFRRPGREPRESRSRYGAALGHRGVLARLGVEEPRLFLLGAFSHFFPSSLLPSYSQLRLPDPPTKSQTVREGLYSESTPIYTAFFDPSSASPSSPSVIHIPHDGSGPGVAWAKREELGAATAKILVSFARGEGEYKNRITLLSGPRAYTLKETVDIIASVYGIQGLKIEQVSVEEYASQPSVKGKQVFAEANGDEEDYAPKWATSWEAIKQGETAVVNGELERILGRKPESFEETLRKAAKQ